MASLLVDLLDVGDEKYSDAVLVRFRGATALIDGAHRRDEQTGPGRANIPGQLATLLGPPPHKIDLLVVSHAHDDHIGCLPELVATPNLLQVKDALVVDPDFGWGRVNDDSDRAPASAAIRRLVAALREEPLPARTPSDAIERFLADAPGIEQRYRSMLDALEAGGTRVVRHIQQSHTALVASQTKLGLNVIGPSELHVLIAAEAVTTESDALADALAMTDVRPTDAVEIYRRITGPMTDAGSGIADAVKRLGAAVNLQSLVLTFGPPGQRVLVAGDMQFAKPGAGGSALATEIAALRAQVKNAGPYRFAKLSHHGSDNAVDGQWLDDLGSPTIVGISTGHLSPDHPDAAVLDLLTARKPALRWVRTDRNHHSQVKVSPVNSKITVDAGALDDADPPADLPILPAAAIEGGGALLPARTAAAVAAPATGPGGSAAAHDPIEVVLRIPAGSPKVTVTVELADGPTGRAISAFGQGTTRADLAYPPLLYVTAPGRLAANVGGTEAAAAIDLLRARPGEVLELADGVDIGTAISQVRARVAATQPRGVVLVGGYDVVPAERADALPRTIRDRLSLNDDADDFIVWSDDGYGDQDGDGLPELPVSRVPDGRSAALLATALAPAAAPPIGARALRNVQRPFADGVYETLPAGRRDMQVSSPIVFSAPSLDVAGDNVYLMLHGDDVDATRFWGEDTPSNLEAMNLDNVASAAGAVVLAGCCWGGLIVDRPAVRVKQHAGFGSRGPDTSIALRFLASGARAFVGCTGSHYSPLEEPYDYFGGPFHRAFWSHLQAGESPAEALFQAKSDYVPGIPHGPATPASTAIELKIWRQFTCLGLGW